MFPWRAAILSLAVLIGALTTVSDSSAHALVMNSVPPANATVAPGNIRIVLTFNSRIDKKRSRVAIHSADEQVTALTTVPDRSDNILQGEIVLTRAGPYQIRWQVLSRDGHITRGIIPFVVRDATAAQ